jgi:hypothetical protein
MCEGRIADAVRPSHHQKAYVCICVFESRKPVKLVVHKDRGWSVLSGDMHPQSADYYCVVGIGHEFDKDPTLLELIDLAPDWEAERTEVGAAWIRKPFAPEDETD